MLFVFRYSRLPLHGLAALHGLKRGHYHFEYRAHPVVGHYLCCLAVNRLDEIAVTVVYIALGYGQSVGV